MVVELHDAEAALIAVRGIGGPSQAADAALDQLARHEPTWRRTYSPAASGALPVTAVSAIAAAAVSVDDSGGGSLLFAEHEVSAVAVVFRDARVLRVILVRLEVVDWIFSENNPGIAACSDGVEATER